MKTIYKRSDLAWISPLQEQAIKVMNKYIDDNKLKDGGSCSMGEGITIKIIPMGCRKPQELMLIRQPFQGNNYIPLKVAKDFLIANNVDCTYECGRMD